MFVTHLRVEGLRHAEALELTDLAAVVRLPPAPAGIAVADAVTLLAGGLDGRRCTAAVEGLGWSTDELEVHRTGDEVDQLTGLDATAVRAVVGDARSARIDVSVQLDPVLYGRLREQAVRDPRVVTALSREAVLTVAVGWLFTRDHTGVAPSVLSVRVGDVSFSTSTKERPQWLPGLLTELGTRFGRLSLAAPTDELAQRMVVASLSAEPAARAAHARLVEALQLPPFELPRLEVVQYGGRLELAFGRDLTWARQLGRGALDAVRVCEAAVLSAPDVLVVDDPLSDELVAWLESCTDGDDATLEQVFVP